MDLWSALTVVGRRWYVVLLGVLLSVGMLSWIDHNVSASYNTVQHAVLFVPTRVTQSQSSDDPQTQDLVALNPFLQYSDLFALAEVLSAVMNDRAVRGQLDARIAESQGYAVTLDRSSKAPLLSISATADTPAAAVTLADTVAARLHSELQHQQRQVGAYRKAFVRVWITTPSPIAEPVVGSRMRAQAAVVLLGLMGSFFAALLVDRALRRKRPALPRKEQQRDARHGHDVGVRLDQHDAAPSMSLSERASCMCGRPDCVDTWHSAADLTRPIAGRPHQ